MKLTVTITTLQGTVLMRQEVETDPDLLPGAPIKKPLSYDRDRLYEDFDRGELTVAELAQKYRVSRATVYQAKTRYDREIASGQRERAGVAPQEQIDEIEPLAPKQPDQSESERRGERTLSDEEFQRVKKLRDEGWNALQMVELLAAPLQQVNYAILSPDYPYYLKKNRL